MSYGVGGPLASLSDAADGPGGTLGLNDGVI